MKGRFYVLFYKSELWNGDLIAERVRDPACACPRVCRGLHESNRAFDLLIWESVGVGFPSPQQILPKSGTP